MQKEERPQCRETTIVIEYMWSPTSSLKVVGTSTRLRTGKPITVLLADDHTVVREGFRYMIERESDIEVVGEAEDGRQAIEKTEELGPDVVVMDIAMPLLNGLEATRRLVKIRPDIRILILSAYSDDAYVENALESGAAGFLVKQSSSRDLGQAIREVQKGKTFFSPCISRRLDRYNGHTEAWGKRRTAVPPLTSRGREVLQLVAEGKANKQIAGELSISIKTVENHRQNVMKLLDIHDTAGLTRYALRAGIIETGVKLTIAPAD
jgi:DNA-binding NarL/FixJ family response regulator